MVTMPHTNIICIYIYIYIYIHTYMHTYFELIIVSVSSLFVILLAYNNIYKYIYMYRLMICHYMNNNRLFSSNSPLSRLHYMKFTSACSWTCFCRPIRLKEPKNKIKKERKKERKFKLVL